MPMGDKLYEAKAKWVMDYISEMKADGILIKRTFKSDVKGMGRFPSGNNFGSGEAWISSEGKLKGWWKGMLATDDGEMIMWKASGNGRGSANEFKGLWVVSYMTKSEKYAWMNALVDVAELKGEMESFSIIGNEWKW